MYDKSKIYNNIKDKLNKRQQIIFESMLIGLIRLIISNKTGFSPQGMSKNPEERDEVVTVLEAMAVWIKVVNFNLDRKQGFKPDIPIIGDNNGSQ